MTFLLLTGLALCGLSFALVLRSLSLGRARQRATLAQIDAYGFRSAPREKTRTRDARDVLHAAASFAGATALSFLGAERERQVRRQLDGAGMYRTTVSTFLGYRVLAATAPIALIGLVVFLGGELDARGVLFAVWLATSGWFAPSFLVKRSGRQRIERIDREVPELVDLLVTTVEAGVAFAGGLQLAAKSIKGPLGDELRLLLQEQSLGLTPEEGLRNLAVRVESPALSSFSQALIQGETLGVSIGKVLRDLAVDMRKRRRQSAEERAQKAPTKILFPLVMLILPAMFIVSLGPVLVRVLEFFGEN